MVDRADGLLVLSGIQLAAHVHGAPVAPAGGVGGPVGVGRLSGASGALAGATEVEHEHI
jgi:hypothetical protein